MYELLQAGPRTWYMDCPAKVGFFQTGEEEVVLIDSGSGKDAVKKIKKHLEARHWTLRAIYNTHSHADHIGGSAALQSLSGCRVFAPGVEAALTRYTALEPSSLFGGRPLPELETHFLMAPPSAAEELTPDVLPEGLSLISLPGHAREMAGFRTADDAVFLADSLVSAETLEKYRVSYLYDVRQYLNSLETVRGLRAACFIPAHAAVTADIAPLAQLNIDKTRETADTVCTLLEHPQTFEELLAALFAHYGLSMSLQQYVLIGSTLRSYLSFLRTEGRADFVIDGGRLLWQRV